MRKTHIMLCAICGLFILSACQDFANRREIVKKLYKFKSAEFKLPDSLIRLNQGLRDTVSNFLSNDNKTLVIFCGPDDCPSCVIDHIREFDSLYDLAFEMEDMEVMFIFSPHYYDRENVMNRLNSLDVQNPVFLDYKGEMYLKNNIPSDPRFHIFVLDENGIPIFVGNPAQSEKAKKVFLKQIS